MRQLTAQAEHRRAIADHQARHAADQQARVDAPLLEAIAAFASLPGRPAPQPPSLTQTTPGAADCNITSKTCRNLRTQRCRIMCKQRGR